MITLTIVATALLAWMAMSRRFAYTWPGVAAGTAAVPLGILAFCWAMGFGGYGTAIFFLVIGAIWVAAMISYSTRHGD